ncbi:MAG: hypothetical protein KF752_15915 [Pirellulaceae bacterium]|nr:hypothetical protein [Pirellulaceae bacterium]
MIRVSVKVGPLSGYAAVDTGSSHNALDESVFALMLEHSAKAKRRFEQTSSRDIKDIVVKSLVVEIDQQPLSIERVKVIDISRLSRVVGGPVLAILGIPFLRDGVLEYDSETKTFSLQPNATHESYEFRQSFVFDAYGTPQTDDSPIAELLNSKFLIDTGCNTALTLTPQTFESAIARGLVKRFAKDVTVVSVESTKAMQSGLLSTASVWGAKFTEVPVTVSDENAIGLALLRQFDFQLDFLNQVLYARPGASCPICLMADRSGLSLEAINSGVSVLATRDLDSTSESRVRSNDLLLSVDNRLVTDRDLLNLRQLFRESSCDWLPVRVARNGVELEAVIRLANPDLR